jgi:hypothetical protein
LAVVVRDSTGSLELLVGDEGRTVDRMLRAHLVDGQPVTDAAAAHGYSRAAFYLVLASFSESGLLDDARGRRGPVKLRAEIVAFIRDSTAGPGELVEQVAERYGVRPPASAAPVMNASATSPRAQNSFFTRVFARTARRGAGRGPP